MPKTPHPAKAAGCTPRQIEAFEQIAVGNSNASGFTLKTIEALLRKGLIVEATKRTIGADAFGPIRVVEFQVPVPVHMQWCKWCSENITDEDLENV